MASELYSRDILRLASSLPHNDSLAYRDGVAERRAPLCGSSMTVEIALSEDRVIGVAINAHACALGQASAAIVRRHAPGSDLSVIASIRERLASALSGNGDIPADWPELAALEPARAHPSRHGAILLPYDALLAAAENARSHADG